MTLDISKMHPKHKLIKTDISVRESFTLALVTFSTRPDTFAAAFFPIRPLQENFEKRERLEFKPVPSTPQVLFSIRRHCNQNLLKTISLLATFDCDCLHGCHFKVGFLGHDIAHVGVLGKGHDLRNRILCN